MKKIEQLLRDAAKTIASKHSAKVKLNAAQGYVVMNIWNLASPNPDTFLALYPQTSTYDNFEILPKFSVTLVRPNCSASKPVTVPPDDQNPSTALVFWGTGMPHSSIRTHHKAAEARTSRETRFLVVPKAHLDLVLAEVTIEQRQIGFLLPCCN
eukprot:gnl/TRDRNA2_/TRDRNA2_169499_c1_seq2.p1 gnl/TRDRNA2_/TRDRNA2_169499_c1~~gnl/TRDRNA2_/TRDRNA2_169499_c1_seq2.p1  ORF type:complete len:154 (+),score=20.20 gnl/TRDRNA2_/TRDRNA2_169499_c1_seq2:151-612(+)